ncbi:MAG TPA: hypothetical protein VFI23_02585 [Rhizomicrobium sp.]|nr:hypothetical protein [Rhizomicrobium sp.]
MIEAIKTAQISPQAKRFLSIAYKTILIVGGLWCLAVAKLAGLLSLAVFGAAAIIYYLAKLIAPKAKEKLLMVSAIMAAQACWMIFAGAYAIHSGQRVTDDANANTIEIFVGLLLAVVYVGGIVWFVRTATVRATTTLFLYVSLLLILYVSRIEFSQLTEPGQSAAALQITMFLVIVVLLPASYYEYTRTAGVQLALSAAPEDAAEIAAHADTVTHADAAGGSQSYVPNWFVGRDARLFLGSLLAVTLIIALMVFIGRELSPQPTLVASPSLEGNDTQPTASTILRAQSADGVIHEFPAGTSQAVIDRVMKEYAISQNNRETDALTNIYPNWREIVGAVDSREKADPANPFRKWLSKQPEAYQKLINETHSASVLIAAIGKFQANKAKSAAPSRRGTSGASE